MAFIKDARTVMIRGRLMLAFNAVLNDGRYFGQIISCEDAKELFELDNSRRACELDYTLIWVYLGATEFIVVYDQPYNGNLGVE